MFTRLEGANFYGATVRSATFQSSDFRQAVFDGENLYRADLRNTVNSYGIRANNADFEEVDARDAALPQMTAHASDWRNSQLQNANLKGGYFQHADFSRAILEGTHFKGTNLDYAESLQHRSESGAVEGRQYVAGRHGVPDLTEPNRS